MNNPYRHADRATQILRKKQIARNRKIAKFDELDIVGIREQHNAVYAAMDKDNRDMYLQIALLAYDDAVGTVNERAKKRNGKRRKPALTARFVDGVLCEYNEVTQYRYDTEVERKRDRAFESLICTNNAASTRIRQMKYWADMTAQYADIVTDRAAMKAYKDMGIKRVRWITQADEKVCEECGALHMEEFDIDNVPDKPHWGCRCWLMPIVE